MSNADSPAPPAPAVGTPEAAPAPDEVPPRPGAPDDPELAAYLGSLTFRDSRTYAAQLWTTLWTGQPEPDPGGVFVGDVLAIGRRLRALASAHGWSDSDPAWEQTRTRQAARDCWAYCQATRTGGHFARRLFDHHFFGLDYPGVSGGSSLQQRVDAELRTRYRGIPAGNYAPLLAPDFVPLPDPNPVPAFLAALDAGPLPPADTPQYELRLQVRKLRTWLTDRPAADQPFVQALFHVYFEAIDPTAVPLPVPTSTCQLDLVAYLQTAWSLAAETVARCPPDPLLAAQAAYQEARAARDGEVAATRAAYPDDPARWVACAQTHAAVSQTMDAYAALRPPGKRR